MADHLASGLRVRPMGLEDIPDGLRLCRASQWNQVAEDWRLFVGSPQGRAFAVEKDDRIVGTVASISYGAFDWIAMMLVDPSERRSGIAGQLMAEVLSALEGVECVGLDATPMAESLYGRHGFVKEHGIARLQATIQGSMFGEPAGGPRRIQPEDLTDILAHDRSVFGADRGLLLTSLFRRAPESAWMVKTGSTIEGYCFGRPGYSARQLGPIVAGDANTARDLAARCLSALDGHQVVIDVPRFDPAWMTWLKSMGFLERRSFERMFRRSSGQHSATFGVPAQQYVIVGPEFA